MGLSDPFQSTYEGSFKAGSQLGAGIQSATTDVVGAMQKNAQRKQTMDMLTKTGILKPKDVTYDDYDAAIKKMGGGINVKGTPEEKLSAAQKMFTAMGIPHPQPSGFDFDAKRASELGMDFDVSTGSLKLNPPSKTASMASQLGMMKEQDKKENVKQLADAIESGNQLADFQSLYGLAGPTKAELQKRGVNVGELQLNALAEKKFVQTLNGPQQTRLRQIIPSVTDGLDILDTLNKDFERTGIKAFNKAKLEALANGAGTKEQQEAASRFITQIAVLSDEAGSLFMNGNTPTDKSIELFQKIVQGDYNDTNINSAIKQLKVNLNIRKNAIENTGAVGVNGPIGQQGQGVAQAAGVMPQQQSNNNDPLGLR